MPLVNPSNDFIPPVGGLLTEQRKAQLFWQLRGRTMASMIRWMFTTARLRLSLVGSLSLFFWIGLFILFYQGFGYLAWMHTDVVQPLFNTFFLALMVMLMFSSGIILYNALFCSPEAAFLADHAGARAANLSAQISGSGLVQQLGFYFARQSDARGVRPGGQCAVVLLRAAFSVCDCLRSHSGGDRRNFVPGGRESSAIDSRACFGGFALGGACGRDLDHLDHLQQRGKRLDDLPLVQRIVHALAIHRAAAVAQLVA